MGVPQLWSTLQKATAVKTLDGNVPQEHAEIAADVDGKTIAVDLSVWMMQAQQSQQLQQVYGDESAQILKVVFERTIHWLRYGCTPVFVVEGHTPAEKREAVWARFGASAGSGGSGRGNREGSWWRQLSRQVVVMLEAMGLTSVQAEGEGEAMCAALNSLGVVDACCTVDIDALLYGATVVYRELQLSTTQAKGCKSVKCEMAAVRKALGIKRGGDLALMALARLIGCDYDLGGVDKVGSTLAWKAVQHLLAGKEDDDDILDSLRQELSNGPDLSCLSLKKCTGCKTCGHESHLKSRPKQHNKTGCRECGTHIEQQGSAGEGGCIPRDFELEECTCAFHRSHGQRWFAKVIQRAVESDGGSSRVDEVYLQGARQAKAAAKHCSLEGMLGWVRRPDVQALHGALAPLDWSYETVRKKVLVLLMEWDVRQGPQPSLPFYVEFRPTSIKSVTQKVTKTTEEGESKERTPRWTYLLKWERVQIGSKRDMDIDTEWLKSSPSHTRTARCSVVEERWPQLTAAFREAQDNKQKKSGGVRGRAGTKGRGGKSVTMSEASEQTQKMQSVMSKFLQQGAKAVLVQDTDAQPQSSESATDNSTSQDEDDTQAVVPLSQGPVSTSSIPQVFTGSLSLLSSQSLVAASSKSKAPAVAKIYQLLPEVVPCAQEDKLPGSPVTNETTLSLLDATSASRPKPVSRIAWDLTLQDDDQVDLTHDSPVKGNVDLRGQSQQPLQDESQHLFHGQSQKLFHGQSQQRSQGPSSKPSNDHDTPHAGTAPSLLRLLSGSQSSLSPRATDLSTSQLSPSVGPKAVGERAPLPPSWSTLLAAAQQSGASASKGSRNSSKTKKASTSSQSLQSTPITKFFNRAPQPITASMTHAESDALSPLQPPITANMTHAESDMLSPLQPTITPSMTHAESDMLLLPPHQSSQATVRQMHLTQLQLPPSQQDYMPSHQGSNHTSQADPQRHPTTHIPLPAQYCLQDSFQPMTQHTMQTLHNITHVGLTHNPSQLTTQVSLNQPIIAPHEPSLIPAYILSPSKRSMSPPPSDADVIGSPSPSKRLQVSVLPSHSPVIDLVSPSPLQPAPVQAPSHPIPLQDLSVTQGDVTTFQPASLMHRFALAAPTSKPTAGESSSSMNTATTTMLQMQHHTALNSTIQPPTHALAYSTSATLPLLASSPKDPNLHRQGWRDEESPQDLDSPGSSVGGVGAGEVMEKVGQLVDTWETLGKQACRVSMCAVPQPSWDAVPGLKPMLVTERGAGEPVAGQDVGADSAGCAHGVVF